MISKSFRSHDVSPSGQKISLQAALLLGFCAMFLVLGRLALRLHLGIPGHAMLVTVFFLLLARGCVAQRGAASFTGLLAGVLVMIWGLGQAGPVVLLNFILPALVIDAGAWLHPRIFDSSWRCALLGALGAATGFFHAYLLGWLVRMDPSVNLVHSLLQSVAGAFFGMVGGALVPPVLRKLKARGLL